MDGTIELVIARYAEDISWVAQTGLPACVYDKSGGQGALLSAAPAVTPLPNVGRESHTYLHHILSRYPDFPDYTVFLQGAPFFHMDEGATPDSLRRTILDLARRNVRFKGLAYYAIRCDGQGNPHHLRDPEHRGKWAGWGRDIPVAATYAGLFAGPVPKSFHTRAPAGLLMVSRERILARPAGLYRKAMELILADPHDAANTGHAMERLWYIVFNGYAPLNRNDYPDSPSCKDASPKDSP